MAAKTKPLYEFGPSVLIAASEFCSGTVSQNRSRQRPLKLLLMLVENSGHIVEKDELMNRVWADSFVEEGNLKVAVSVLRKALEQGGGEHQYIETIPRRGYRFKAQVREHLEERPQFMLVERHT